MNIAGVEITDSVKCKCYKTWDIFTLTLVWGESELLSDFCCCSVLGAQEPFWESPQPEPSMSAGQCGGKENTDTKIYKSVLVWGPPLRPICGNT